MLNIPMMAKLNFQRASVTWSYRNYSYADLVLKKHFLLLSMLNMVVLL